MYDMIKFQIKFTNSEKFVKVCILKIMHLDFSLNKTIGLLFIQYCNQIEKNYLT